MNETRSPGDARIAVGQNWRSEDDGYLYCVVAIDEHGIWTRHPNAGKYAPLILTHPAWFDHYKLTRDVP